MKQIYKIDNQGYMIFGDEIEIKIDEVCPNGYTDIPLPKDAEGNQLPFYRPKLVGLEWIEDITQEEIDIRNNVIQEPTEIELLKIKLQKAEELATENSLNQQLLLELLIDLGVL